MKLILASNNQHKLTEIKAILGGCFDEILTLREAGIVHETVEDGKTFMENAVKKARELAEISGCCAIADDSGLCVDALGGAPGVESVTGLGLMIGIKGRRKSADVIADCREKGVLCLSAKEKVRLLPPLNIPMDLLETAVGVLKDAFAKTE